MISFLVYWFMVITGAIPFWLIFRTKISFEDRKVQGRKINKKTIVVSNHLALFDYVVFLVATIPYFSHPLAAEILFNKNIFMTLLLKMLGAIKVERFKKNGTAYHDSVEALNTGKILYINPEGRLPAKDELTPLRFHTGFVRMALETNSKIIPVYSDGNAFSLKRAHLVIGKPLDLKEYLNSNLSESDNVRIISSIVRSKIISLGASLEK